MTDFLHALHARFLTRVDPSISRVPKAAAPLRAVPPLVRVSAVFTPTPPSTPRVVDQKSIHGRVIIEQPDLNGQGSAASLSPAVPRRRVKIMRRHQPAQAFSKDLHVGLKNLSTHQLEGFLTKEMTKSPATTVIQEGFRFFAFLELLAQDRKHQHHHHNEHQNIERNKAMIKAWCRASGGCNMDAALRREFEIATSLLGEPMRSLAENALKDSSTPVISWTSNPLLPLHDNHVSDEADQDWGKLFTTPLESPTEKAWNAGSDGGGVSSSETSQHAQATSDDQHKAGGMQQSPPANAALHRGPDPILLEAGVPKTLTTAQCAALTQVLRECVSAKVCYAKKGVEQIGGVSLNWDVLHQALATSARARKVQNAHHFLRTIGAGVQNIHHARSIAERLDTVNISPDSKATTRVILRLTPTKTSAPTIERARTDVAKTLEAPEALLPQFFNALIQSL